jgi:alpha-mannosidase II
MNDEATSTYTATIIQLTEGHEWLKREFNYKPNAGWSIDPFGYTPTQAYILSKAGFDFMLIQRY